MEIWTSYWEAKKQKSIVEVPPKLTYGGTNTEPLASIGMACFLDASRERFHEGYSILDYGCGAGILGNFISERLNDFKYYGLEPKSAHGIERIALGKEVFNDERIFLGFIEDDLKTCLSKKLDTITLISVFTHLLKDDIFNILDSLTQTYEVSPACDIVFSCFTSDVERVENLQPHIWERFYGTSYIRESDLQEYCAVSKLKLTKHMSFVAQGGYVHDIFKINKV